MIAGTEAVLALLKADLGIRHEKQDDRLNAMLAACEAELAEKGIELHPLSEDMMLLSDFAAWRWRSRLEDRPALSDSLRYRIRNRQARGRAHAE
ncbi:MAG: hypothetical protein ACI3XZ_04940 [Butyricicoccus sp.]